MLIFFTTLTMLLALNQSNEVNHYTLDTGEHNIISYSVSKNSWMILSGTTNVNSFECLSEKGIYGVIPRTNSEPGDNRINFSDTHLLVKVNSFDCKNPYITRDMHNSLGGDRNSNIEIKLFDTKLLDEHSGESNRNFKANAVITVNDQSNIIELIIDWHQSGPFEYHFEGKADLAMSDFGITPPSPALGLVKVNDKITVHFSYTVQPDIISGLD